MGDIELGLRLKQAREKANLTQDKACEEAGIAKVQTLSSYERGVNNPPLETIKNLSLLYNISVDTLLFGENKTHFSEKNTIDYIVQLVDAVDNLGMRLKTESCGFPEVPDDYLVDLYIENSDFMEFVVKWFRLRSLLDSNTIEKYEYDVLMSQRIKDLHFYLTLPF